MEERMHSTGNNKHVCLAQALAATRLLGGVEGWVPTEAVAALLLLAAEGSMQSKLDVMFWLLDRFVRRCERA